MRDILCSRDSPIAYRHRTDCGGGMEHRPRRHHTSGRRVRRKPLHSAAHRNRERQEGGAATKLRREGDGADRLVFQWQICARVEGGRNLSIDKAGIGYRLKYDFLKREEAQWEDTSTFTIGEQIIPRRRSRISFCPFLTAIKHATGSYFNVEIGPPHQLKFLRHSSGGWAGNQPFSTQPKLALVDAGGNIVVGDSSSMVTAHVTPSMAHNSMVIIDTSNDAIPIVT